MLSTRVVVIATGSGLASYIIIRLCYEVGVEVCRNTRRGYETWRGGLYARVAGMFTRGCGSNKARHCFQAQLALPNIRTTPGHSHGNCAANRTAAARAMQTFADKINCVPYVVSLSSRDIDAPLASHGWHMSKDVIAMPRADVVPTDAVILMVDVDYYVDLAQWLEYERPMLLYTFDPEEVTYSDPKGEYSYTILGSEVTMSVSGGNVYKHQLWDYSHDYAYVRLPWWKHMLVSIDRKRVDRHHVMVLLSPVRVVRWFGGCVPHQPIIRRYFGTQNLVVNQYRANGTTAKPGGEMISLASVIDGEVQTSVTVPLALYQAARIRLEESKHASISDVERMLRDLDMDNALVLAPLFYRTLKGHKPRYGPSAHKPGLFDPLDRFQTIDPLVYEDGKEIGVTVCASLVTSPDVVPNRSYNNDYASVTGRVYKVMTDTEPPVRFAKYAKEFVALVVADKAGTGIPYSIDDVIQMQDRPVQRGRSEKAKHWVGVTNGVSVQAFMKGESYAKPSDPRNISTVGVSHMLQLSGFTYKFKEDCLQQCEWYAPGKTPSQIAHRLVTIMTHYDVCETDYSRFDGTLTEWIRYHVERAIYLCWVHPSHREHLVALLEAEYNRSARTSCGFAYSPGFTRFSGSPLTTDGNTEVNGFTAFAAAREAGLTASQAWQMMGIHAGDDGVSRGKASYLEQTAKHLGLQLKCIPRKRQVCFLGRVFLDPGAGNLGSLQDPERTWRKLHISFSPVAHADPKQALANRAYGYLTLDPGAPVVSTWARRVLHITGLLGCVDLADTTYYARLQNTIPDFGGWPQLTWSQALDTIAWRLEITSSSVADLDARIGEVTTLQGFHHLYVNPVVEPSTTAVLRGQIQYAPNSERSQRRHKREGSGKPPRQRRDRADFVGHGIHRRQERRFV